MLQLTDDQLEEFNERAAIMQYDGKMSREQAEAKALSLLFPDEVKNDLPNI